MSTRAQSRSNAYHPPVRDGKEMDYKLRNLSERVTALERVVHQLVTWTKIELLHGDNPVNDEIQLEDYYGDTNNHPPTVRNVSDAAIAFTKSSRGRGVAKKSTSGVRKNLQEKVDTNHQDFSISGLKTDEDAEIKVKLEPIEFLEINPVDVDIKSDGGASFEGGDDFEDNSGDEEDYMFLFDPFRKKSSPTNMDSFDDDDDDDYDPQEDDESGSNSSYIPIKKTSNIPPKYKARLILPSSQPEPTLPNPYIRLGPILTPEQLASSHNININDYILPKTKTTKGRRPKKRKIQKPRVGWRFQCDQCPYGSNFKRKYTEHYRHHTGERPYLCDTCGKGFRGNDSLQAHIKNCANNPTIPCPVEGCSETFKQEKLIESHVNKMHKDSRRQCDICQKIFSGPWTLNYHKKRMHQERTFICPICSQKFAFARELRNHVAMHSKPNYVYHDSSKRRRQVDEKEEEPIPPEPLDTEKIYVVPPKFVCSEEGCGKSFPREMLLRYHVRAKHWTDEERKVTCDLCGIIMKDHNHLRNHVNYVHTEERPHVCVICGQAFKLKTHLTRHERGHANPNWKPRGNCKPKTFNPPKKEAKNQGLDLPQEPSSSCEMVDYSLEGGDHMESS